MKSPVKRNDQSGFTLLEVVVALGIFVFAVTTLMGVMPFGMTQVQSAANESRSLGVMESIRDDISLALEAGMAKTLRYKIDIPATGGDRALDLNISDDGEIASSGGIVPFKIVGNLRRAAENSGEADFLHLRASWPPKAPAGREDGSTELIAAFKP